MLPNAPAEAEAQGKKLPKIATADAAMIKIRFLFISCLLFSVYYSIFFLFLDSKLLKLLDNCLYSLAIIRYLFFFYKKKQVHYL